MCVDNGFLLSSLGCFLQETEVLREKSEAVDHSSQQKENEEGVSAQATSWQQRKREENKMTGASAWEAEKIVEARNEVSCEKVPDWPLASPKDLVLLVNSVCKYALPLTKLTQENTFKRVCVCVCRGN